MSKQRRVVAVLGTAALGLLGAISPAAADPGAIAAVAEPVGAELWTAARGGAEAEFARALERVAGPESTGVNEPFRDSVSLFEANLHKREAQRTELSEKASAELDEQIAAAREKDDPIALSKALASTVQLQLLLNDDDALFAQPRVNELIERSEKAARAAESRGDWLVANELYFRLDTLLDKDGKYGDAVRRLGTRLNMIRLYAPERLWQLRNDRRVADGEDPLPPYNPYGDDYHQKLSGIGTQMIYRALQHAQSRHVNVSPQDPESVTMGSLLKGGLDAIETMATTADLKQAFPGLRDEAARERFLATVRSLRTMVDELGAAAGGNEMRSVISRLLASNDQTVRILDEAVLHEFGNGAMGTLDDYTAVIWPDELARFRRSTQGEFIGIGVQISMDELMNIEVVTPLEGTPAQRAGIRSGDIIKKVNGLSAVGLGLDQAVEIITGPQDTTVSLTIERPGPDADSPAQELDFQIVRKRIDLPSVKGWRKVGPGDYDWDWFIDADAGVGYIRLTGFTEDTTRDFDRAVAAMKRQGLSSLILDLRYNPGGLLEQAVDISSRFVPEGLIVRTETGSGLPTGEPMFSHRVVPDKSLAKVPVVVLINEGSASASEIVSGALQAAAHQGKIRALLVGQRTFGKGSVQNVFALSGGDAAMKLTTQYYRIDSPRLIHRRPGSTEWGIDPDLEVEMLPDQQVEALLLRRDSDVLPLDEFGNIIANAERPDPDTLLTDGIDLQVQTALVLLQSQNADPMLQSARLEN